VYRARSGLGYVPGFYENACSTSSGFASAYCAAVSATPGLSDGVVLFASEPSYKDVSPTKSARPDFAPIAPLVRQPNGRLAVRTTLGISPTRPAVGRMWTSTSSADPCRTSGNRQRCSIAGWEVQILIGSRTSHPARCSAPGEIEAQLPNGDVLGSLRA
jgi:hypothetical protein